MKKRIKIQLLILISVGGIIGLNMIVLIVLKEIANIYNSIPRDKQRQRSFTGIVEELSFGDKNAPIVVVNGNEYCLGIYDPSIQEIIRKDDSIVKRKGETNYWLYRRDSTGNWQLVHKRQNPE